MKYFTLCATALLMAASAAAAPATPQKLIPNSHKAIPGTSLRHSGAPALRAKAKRAQALEPITDAIVLEQPAGKLSNWSKDCIGWSFFWGMVLDVPVSGSAQQMVEGDDGKVWMNMQFSQWALGDVWTYAEKQADGSLVVPAGQMVYAQEYDGEVENFYLVPMTFDYDEEGNYLFEYYDSVTYTYEDGKYVQKESDRIMGLCAYMDGSFEWTGYGDQEITFSPMTSVMTPLPESVKMEKWAAMVDLLGYFVNVGFEGDKIYIQGLMPDCPDGVAEGTVEGDKVIVPGGQFQGMSEWWSWSYLYGGAIEEVYDEWYEDYYMTPVVKGDLHFSYDAEAKRLVAEDVIISATSCSEDISTVEAESYLEELTITLQHRDPNAKPMTPEDLAFYDDFDDYGYSTFTFTVYDVDVNGDLLDDKNLYYRVYLDGEPFTFYPDEYFGVAEDGQELISAYENSIFGIYSSGVGKAVEFYLSGIDTLGVQSVYFQPVEGGEPVMLESEIATMDISAVRALQADSQTVSSEWYDLQGRRVANPAAGLYVRVDRKADGSRVAVKSVVK